MNLTECRVLRRQGIAILCFAMLVGCGSESGTSTADGMGAGLQKARLALNWYPEVEHGGFIAAETLGLFAAEGLSVEIIPGGPGAPQSILLELEAGRIEFAVSDADNVVKARAAGLPIVALLAPLQNSPRCILVHESSGIQSLEDLSDLELAISDSRPFALWMKKKLPLKNVTMVPFSGSVGEFLLKTNFAQQGFVFSEPYVAREKGGDPRVLMLSDIGFNPYASVLITTESVIQRRPELVQSVVRCCQLGWQRYLQDPGVTNAAIHAMNRDMSPDALEYGVREMAPLCTPPAGKTDGEMELERWQTLISQIEEIDDIERGSVRPEECFTNQFLVRAGDSEEVASPER